jgi:sugar-specific transcriptional regulator TrmB
MTLKNKDVTKTIVNPLLERLISFGFSHHEAAIYLYLLERGTDTGGSKIAIGTKLHRQYVYLALPKLIESGLVEEIPHGKQARYRAEAPQVIETLGRKKAIEASDLARELNLISNIGNEQDFEVIQGMRAIQQHEMGLVARADDLWECYIIGGGSIGYSKVMGEYLESHLDEMERKKLPIRYIGSASERPFYKDYIGRFENQEFRFLEKLPTGATHLVVRQDTVSFYTFLNPPLVYVVKSKQIADNYHTFFDMLWEMAKE